MNKNTTETHKFLEGSFAKLGSLNTVSIQWGMIENGEWQTMVNETVRDERQCTMTFLNIHIGIDGQGLLLVLIPSLKWTYYSFYLL